MYCPPGSGSVRTMPATEQRVALPPRYRVLRHIADGGMASVWAAEDELLGRLVAVKVLARAYDADERARRRFLREARAAAKLGDCRHVVTSTTSASTTTARSWSWSTSPAGRSPTGCARRRRIPRRVALRWLRETAIALDCAHGHDVVHRDVKPGNLLLDEHGRLAVGDFGIATRRQRGVGHADRPGPRHRRLHLARAGAAACAATAASDRYALAVVAFELLTGARPVRRRRTPPRRPAPTSQAEVPAASDVVRGLPRAVDAVLRARAGEGPRRRARPAPRTSSTASRTRSATRPTAVVPPPTAATRRLDAVAPPRAGAAAAEPRRAAAARAARDRRPPTTARRAPVTPPPARLAAARPAAAAGRRRGPRRAAARGGRRRRDRADGGGRRLGRRERPGRRPRAAGEHDRAAAATGSTPPTTSTATQAQSAPAPTATGPAPPPARPAPAARGLNNQGFTLLQQGNPAAAVPLLQQSVDGFRPQGRTSEPTTPSRSTTSPRPARDRPSGRRDPAARGAPAQVATTSAAP